MKASALGRIGIWSMEMRFGDRADIVKAAPEIEALGFGTLWIPGGLDGGVLEGMDTLLPATSRMVLATGILNIWKHEPRQVADWFNALPSDQRARVMLGLGVSHGPIIGESWKKPLAVTREFLDGLGGGVPQENLCLAALGPKMLELSRDRTAGAHPYLATPEHTASARRILGAGKLLAPEQGVILETDPAKARDMGRQALKMYSRLPNYRNNWLRLGFQEADIDRMSDSFVDAVFAWGSDEQIAARVRAHHQAGADHVCLQVIQGSPGIDVPGLLAACRRLAAFLL